MPASSFPVRSIEFQRAMIFVDGTNLFYRLEASKLRLRGMDGLVRVESLIAAQTTALVRALA